MYLVNLVCFERSYIIGDCFSVCFVMVFNICHQDNRDHNAVTVLEHLLTWVDTELLVLLRSRRAPKRRLLNQTDMTLLSTTGFDTTMDTTMSTTLQGSKRTARDGHPPALVDMATKITQVCIYYTRNVPVLPVHHKYLNATYL